MTARMAPVAPAPRALRQPDQFRPSRDRAIAATPTCCSCCCCCCCVATLITSSVILPMQVEMAHRRSDAAYESAAGSKMLAGVAPILGTTLAVAIAYLTGNPALTLATFVGSIGVLVGMAFVPFGTGAVRGVSTPIVILIAFVVEVFVGAAGILLTYGIGYLLVGIIAMALVIGSQRRRLDAVSPYRTLPGATGAPRPPSEPPPLPRRPSDS